MKRPRIKCLYPNLPAIFILQTCVEWCSSLILKAFLHGFAEVSHISDVVTIQFFLQQTPIRWGLSEEDWLFPILYRHGDFALGFSMYQLHKTQWNIDFYHTTQCLDLYHQPTLAL